MIEIGRSLEAWSVVLCGFTEINFMTLCTEFKRFKYANILDIIFITTHTRVKLEILVMFDMDFIF